MWGRRAMLLLGGIGFVLLFFVAVTAGGDARGPLTIRDPKERGQKGEPPPLVLPLDVNDALVTYTATRTNEQIRRADGRPVGQLAALPLGLTTVEVGSFSAGGPEPTDDQIGLVFLGHIRYSGNGQYVTVTTVQLTPAAARQSLLLGEEKIQLADGSNAYVWGNKIVAVRGDYLIVIRGNEPIAALREIAANAQLQR